MTYPSQILLCGGEDVAPYFRSRLSNLLLEGSPHVPFPSVATTPLAWADPPQPEILIVLIGAETWRYRSVDDAIWQFLAQNPLGKKGLAGVLLPDHPAYEQVDLTAGAIPTRLLDNLNQGVAGLYDWETDGLLVSYWLNEVLSLGKMGQFSNQRPRMKRNLSRKFWQ